MYSAKLIAFLLSLRAMFMPCCPKPEAERIQVQEKRAYTRLTRGLTESSALELAPEGSFWTLLDSGAPATLYRISAEGQLLDSVSLPLRNKDWEELARDTRGNLYIGDFGNNLNRRRDLKVYRYHPEQQQLDSIIFQWEDQLSFPPEKKALNFDCEAFVWHQDQLHFFTKSRGNKMVRHYVLPDQPGSYEAKLLETSYVKDLVTAADISPDGKRLALLTYGKVYLYDISAPELMLQHPAGCLRLNWAGQSESILFIQNNSLLVGNERGRLFYIQLQP